MPAAAGATCVGGQGVHWTCATPRPAAAERDRASSTTRSGTSTSRRGGLLHVHRPDFTERPAGGRHPRARPRRVRAGRHHRPAAVRSQRTHGRTVARWSGTDVVLGPLADGAYADRFTLRAGDPVHASRPRGERVVGAVLRDQPPGGGRSARRRRRARRRRAPDPAAAVGLGYPTRRARPLPHRTPSAVRRRGGSRGRAPRTPGSRRPDRSHPGHRRHPVRRGASPVLRAAHVQRGVPGAAAGGQQLSGTTPPATSGWAGGSASDPAPRTA